MRNYYISSEEFDYATEQELQWLDDAYQYEEFINEQKEKYDLERSTESI
jgi:hypothetical protein